MTDLDGVGGIPMVMKALLDEGLLDGDALTVTGKTVTENLEVVPQPDGAVLKGRRYRRGGVQRTCDGCGLATASPVARHRPHPGRGLALDCKQTRQPPRRSSRRRRLHDLRHDAASLSLAAGNDVENAQVGAFTTRSHQV
ncbi:hypothetical protein GKO32_15040 [Amycolatopsis sp. RM579]|uniref:Dihydroxy-acid/6-phosphogluconate dehydratase N-terminal domain-containing protein n=1 Tax=Amycolatopsis pithecellobii TaxID=664692 RepID=A0A6N7Z4K1_9PSEU|nr:hypothetical protein [Amycolatopsis pithecellobii]